uniref:Uncharacterized protein n=1 Tax=Ditylum brightwellii TaxID=49249 RepID=A0A6U3TSW4_9STRA
MGMRFMQRRVEAEKKKKVIEQEEEKKQKQRNQQQQQQQQHYMLGNGIFSNSATAVAANVIHPPTSSLNGAINNGTNGNSVPVPQMTAHPNNPAFAAWFSAAAAAAAAAAMASTKTSGGGSAPLPVAFHPHLVQHQQQQQQQQPSSSMHLPQQTQTLSHHPLIPGSPPPWASATPWANAVVPTPANNINAILQSGHPSNQTSATDAALLSLAWARAQATIAAAVKSQQQQTVPQDVQNAVASSSSQAANYTQHQHPYQIAVMGTSPAPAATAVQISPVPNNTGESSQQIWIQPQQLKSQQPQLPKQPQSISYTSQLPPQQEKQLPNSYQVHSQSQPHPHQPNSHQSHKNQLHHQPQPEGSELQLQPPLQQPPPNSQQTISNKSENLIDHSAHVNSHHNQQSISKTNVSTHTTHIERTKEDEAAGTMLLGFLSKLKGHAAEQEKARKDAEKKATSKLRPTSQVSEQINKGSDGASLSAPSEDQKPPSEVTFNHHKIKSKVHGTKRQRNSPFTGGVGSGLPQERPMSSLPSSNNDNKKEVTPAESTTVRSSLSRTDEIRSKRRTSKTLFSLTTQQSDFSTSSSKMQRAGNNRLNTVPVKSSSVHSIHPSDISGGDFDTASSSSNICRTQTSATDGIAAVVTDTSSRSTTYPFDTDSSSSENISNQEQPCSSGDGSDSGKTDNASGSNSSEEEPDVPASKRNKTSIGEFTSRNVADHTCRMDALQMRSHLDNLSHGNSLSRQKRRN